MSLTSLPGILQQQGAGPFNPETDITWHSLFWAEGTNMAAQGYSDLDDVGTWPNETAESDLTQSTTLWRPHYEDSKATLNNKPAVQYDGSSTHLLTLTSWTADPGYSSTYLTVVFVFTIDSATTSISYLASSSLTEASDRHQYWHQPNSSNRIATYHGATQTDAVGGTTGAKFFRFRNISTTANDLGLINETQRIAGNAGTGTGFDALAVGNRATDRAREMNGAMAFVGIYEGDITADGSWSDFKTWVTDHYGITLA